MRSKARKIEEGKHEEWGQKVEWKSDVFFYIKEVMSNHPIPLGFETDYKKYTYPYRKQRKKRLVYVNQPAQYTDMTVFQLMLY